jgi:hypoxanthine phosphoribosyltransferase
MLNKNEPVIFEPDRIQKLFSAAEIHCRIEELAQEIYHDYAQRQEDFWILYLERGARLFAENLKHKIIKLDSGHGRYRGLQSITTSRTRGAGFLHEIKLDGFQPQEVAGKNILLVEDLADQGHTLAAVAGRLKNLANSYRTCVLVDKTEDRQVPVTLDHIGFQIARGWVVGMGMDLAEYGRDLPFIGIIGPAAGLP